MHFLIFFYSLRRNVESALNRPHKMELGVCHLYQCRNVVLIEGRPHKEAF